MATGSGIGAFARLKLSLGAMFGDETAKKAKASLERQEELSRWHQAFWMESRQYEPEVQAMRDYSETDVRERAESAWQRLRDGNDRLAQDVLGSEQAVRAQSWDAASALLDALQARRGELEAARVQLVSAIEDHLSAQREAWSEVEECESCQRAAALADELDRSPDVPGLSKPDLREFRSALDAVRATVPEEARDRGLDRVCFAPPRLQAHAEELKRQAPPAEETATRYFYELVRGYEADLGPEQTKRMRQMLQDPSTLRGLQTSHPELFAQRGALAGSGAFGMNLLPMLLMASMMSDMNMGWHAHPGASQATPESMQSWSTDLGSVDSDLLARIEAGSLDDDFGPESDPGDGEDFGGDFG